MSARNAWVCATNPSKSSRWADGQYGRRSATRRGPMWQSDDTTITGASLPGIAGSIASQSSTHRSLQPPFVVVAVARDREPAHHTRLVHVPRPSSMQDTPVVPYDDIADGPSMGMDAWRSARVLAQFVDQTATLFSAETDDASRMATDEQ